MDTEETADKDQLRNRLAELQAKLLKKKKKLQKAEKRRKVKEHVQEKIREHNASGTNALAVPESPYASSDTYGKSGTSCIVTNPNNDTRKGSVQFQISKVSPQPPNERNGSDKHGSVTEITESYWFENSNVSTRSSPVIKMKIPSRIVEKSTIRRPCVEPSDADGKLNVLKQENYQEKDVHSSESNISNIQSVSVKISQNTAHNTSGSTLTPPRKRLKTKLSPIPKIVPDDAGDIVHSENAYENNFSDVAFIQYNETVPNTTVSDSINFSPVTPKAGHPRLRKYQSTPRNESTTFLDVSLEMIPDTQDTPGSIVRLASIKSEAVCQITPKKKEAYVGLEKEENAIDASKEPCVQTQEIDAKSEIRHNETEKSKSSSSVSDSVNKVTPINVIVDGIMLDLSCLTDESKDMYSQVKSRRRTRSNNTSLNSSFNCQLSNESSSRKRNKTQVGRGRKRKKNSSTEEVKTENKIPETTKSAAPSPGNASNRTFFPDVPLADITATMKDFTLSGEEYEDLKKEVSSKQVDSTKSSPCNNKVTREDIDNSEQSLTNVEESAIEKSTHISPKKRLPEPAPVSDSQILGDESVITQGDADPNSTDDKIGAETIDTLSWRPVHTLEIDEHIQVVTLEFLYHDDPEYSDMIVCCGRYEILLFEVLDSELKETKRRYIQDMELLEASCLLVSGTPIVIGMIRDTQASMDTEPGSCYIEAFYIDDTETQGITIATFEGYLTNNPIHCILPDSNTVVWGQNNCDSQTCELGVLNLDNMQKPNGDLAKVKIEGVSNTIMKICPIENQSHAICGFSMSIVYIWNVEIRALLCKIEVTEYTRPRNFPAVVSEEGLLFFVVLEDSDDAAGKVVAANPLSGKMTSVLSLEQTPDPSLMAYDLSKSMWRGEYSAALYQDGTVNMWNVFSGKLLAHKPSSKTKALALHRHLQQTVCYYENRLILVEFESEDTGGAATDQVTL